MPLTTKPMTDAELAALEEGRDFHADLLQSIREMKAGQGTVVYSPVIAARTAAGLSQAQFASLMGVSVRTLQDWEQGRRQPSGAARTLIKVAERHPEVLRELTA
ncbi:MAG: helix-turn-helix domain-containing protein [Candidatus Competibacteraceae bacterium]|nr:helix-turn-helix domain-containing protein [Candidatus Competibacteraceae bacterium]MBK7984464.1 helix-turn-helix domain-containing protein [Candidatus Competibacteraceae bacterium]MBK8897270.1 helix-turn-helix domain-containing protein [Candidatus Competibacteraceae bacterium]MBK8964763.1 helix-turn-helix domain-containing protein [Candidatus Competibacteraceae bacterium]MBK9950038.1 helix-turn-helix domain-containing protein [Candidatus Competibacteraceae bacterium]